MTPVLQSALPYDPYATGTLPGIRPLGAEPWLIADDAFAAQMAEREALLHAQRGEVLALDETARPAAEELLDQVLAEAYPGAAPNSVTRPDGNIVRLDRADPLATLGRLVQEDFCLLQKIGNQHVLTGAVLCFPANWTLGEKFMRPLDAIHDPVEAYDEAIARRVQRLFDGVRVGVPIWRYNALWYADPTLFQPSPEGTWRPHPRDARAPYLRSERQVVLRLPCTRAVVFSIHTYVVRRAVAQAARTGAA